MSKEDYYKTLGTSKSASSDELKKAYRKLAMKYHPDRNKGDPSAEKKFKEINEAYEVLKDDQKRAAYDRYGHGAFDGSGGSGYSQNTGGFGGFQQQSGNFQDFSDIFGGIFDDIMGGGRAKQRQQPEDLRGSDLRYNLNITLEEASKGKQHTIKYSAATSCSKCSGTGSKNPSGVIKCSTCGGSGAIRMQQGFFIMEQTCHSCSGSGQMIKDPCSYCRGEGAVTEQKTVSIDIPAGIESESQIKLSGKGEAGRRGSRAGDLYIFVTIQKHDFYTRKGNDLHCQVPIKMTVAALGGSIDIPGLDQTMIKLNVPAGTQNGSKLRLKGKGMPIIRSEEIGDLFVHIKVETPIKLTAKQKALLEQFDAENEHGSNPDSDGFINKMKNLWSDMTK